MQPPPEARRPCVSSPVGRGQEERGAASPAPRSSWVRAGHKTSLWCRGGEAARRQERGCANCFGELDVARRFCFRESCKPVNVSEVEVITRPDSHQAG